MLDDPLIDRSVLDDRLEYLIDLADELLITLIHSSSNILGLRILGSILVSYREALECISVSCNDVLSKY